MAQNEIYKKIAEDVKGINESIVTARDLISALREAGENVDQMKSKLDELERKKVKWEKMLANRGY